MSGKRPPVKIKFKYNLETGDIEQFIVDDNAAGASEEYHDRVALAIGDLLAHRAEIEDAGPRHAAVGSGALDKKDPAAIKKTEAEKL